MWDEVEIEVEVEVEAGRGSHDSQLRPLELSSTMVVERARLGIG